MTRESRLFPEWHMIGEIRITQTIRFYDILLLPVAWLLWSGFAGCGSSSIPTIIRPEHVHVIGASKESVFELNCPAGPVVVRENYGFSRTEIGAIKKALSQRVGALCRRWREIHGQR